VSADGEDYDHSGQLIREPNELEASGVCERRRKSRRLDDLTAALRYENSFRLLRAAPRLRGLRHHRIRDAGSSACR
jgi:hypothetical protein